MKKLILTLFITVPFLLTGQSTGEIIYKETVKFEIELPEGMEQFKDQIPSSQQFTKTLLFNSKAMIYKDVDLGHDDNHSMSSDNGGVQMMVQIERPDNQTYVDLKSGKTIEKKDFMGKKFIVEGKAKRYKWNMTGEQKKIMDYNCQKAIYKDTSGNIVAWFTSEIPVSAGPETYSGLPGMILEMDIDDGTRKIVATVVELKNLDKDAIEIPKKGKKVNEEEFDKIVEEKTKELQEEFGGGGNVIIQTRRQ